MKKIALLALFIHSYLIAQEQIVIDLTRAYQVIDGFGAFQAGDITTQTWWQYLYIHDLECSVYRIDLTPRLKSPYSDLSYYSPWFMGSQTKSLFNLEDPTNPDGPENNRVRTYTGPGDYSRLFGGRNAPIAVMGPDIESNINNFTYPVNGAIAELLKNKVNLGDVKIIGSIWSPVPWVKVSSGNTYRNNWWPGPVTGSRWPFIWGGNFAGGRLDVSGNKYNVFDDRAFGGSGPTDAVTQFARSSAAYILGFQRQFKFQFYAISIQNELNFEEYYNSMTYPLSSQYITALKAIKAEFSRYPELRAIKIMGPEDLLGGDAYGMWEYGGPVHKNLQYLSNIAKDPDASAALDFFCIHGYASDGVSSAGANAGLWDWWANGWSASPAPGIPSNVKGFVSYNKKSWMTETSGENREWLYPKNAYPNSGAWSLALKIHQALTTGMQSAWVHWTFVDSNSDGTVSDYGITNQAAGLQSPKYNAIKHFFKFIRPDSRRFHVNTASNASVLCSSYFNQKDNALTMVLINTSSSNENVIINIPEKNKSLMFNDYLSWENNYFNSSSKTFVSGTLALTMPPYSVRTLTGKYDLFSGNNKYAKLDHHVVFDSERNLLTIEGENIADLKNIIITDISSGLSSVAIVLGVSSAGRFVQIPNLVPGVYFINYQINDKTFCTKIVKYQ